MKKYLFYIFIICIQFSCNNTDNTTKEKEDTGTENQPTNISYQIIKEYPHDTAAFTEGLQYANGKLYESVGNYKTSDLRVVDINTGKPLQQKKLEDRYFGEGITLLNGKIYQLTYKENTAFVYDAKTLKQEKTFTYNQGEGWGLTNDGSYLIMSTGSSNLFYIDPNTFKEVKRVGVYDQNGPLPAINELEYIKGFVYANQWMTDYIYKIDPASGKVVGKVDLGDLKNKTGIAYKGPNEERGPDVLNGIAYDSANNKIFITGKNWPKLFEVKLDN